MRARTCIAVIMMVVVCGVSVLAQKGGKAVKLPFKWPGTAEFRSNCDLVTPDAPCPPASWPPESEWPDLIVGDGGNYQFVPEQGGAGIYSGNGNLHIALSYPNYHLRLDFSQPLDKDTRPCLFVVTTCRWNHYGAVVLERAEVQGHVVDASGNDVEGGLFAMPINEPGWRSGLRIGFRTADGLLWNVRFQASLYADATDIDVLRTDKCRWVFTAGDDAVAGLNGWGQHPNAKGNQNVTTNEGLFRMPTQFTLQLVSYSGYTLPTACQ